MVCILLEYMEDIEGFWSKTWRTELFLTSWVTSLYPREVFLKFYVYFFFRSVEVRVTNKNDIDRQSQNMLKNQFCPSNWWPKTSYIWNGHNWPHVWLPSYQFLYIRVSPNKVRSFGNFRNILYFQFKKTFNKKNKLFFCFNLTFNIENENISQTFLLIF